MLDEEREEQNRLRVILAIFAARIAQRRFQVVHSLHDDGIVGQRFELLVETENLEQVRVCVVVTHFALGERGSDGADLGLGDFLVHVSPERFHGHFDLGDGEERIGDGASFGIADADFEVLNVAREIELGVDPVRVTNGIDVLHELGVFVRLQRDALFEQVALPFFGTLRAVHDERLGDVVEAPAHERLFHGVLNGFDLERFIRCSPEKRHEHHAHDAVSVVCDGRRENFVGGNGEHFAEGAFDGVGDALLVEFHQGTVALLDARSRAECRENHGEIMDR